MYYWVIPAALNRLSGLLQAPTAPVASGQALARPVRRMSLPGLGRRVAAEAVGLPALVAVVVGSGIQADRLSRDGRVELLAGRGGVWRPLRRGRAAW
ncbi:hypothetical protein Aple_064610 [Acrocarpospora pleiomorpha]|uniref:Uncharacterized protein n=1 Tax=Acrocarpospora pleiomorpha TaxID=90975 RepID=A0A5M3XR91_9ACTN|nr:hypothetical protein Aple_064610 [Acrocarpospora pleiomorpha]